VLTISEVIETDSRAFSQPQNNSYTDEKSGLPNVAKQRRLKADRRDV